MTDAHIADADRIAGDVEWLCAQLADQEHGAEMTGDEYEKQGKKEHAVALYEIADYFEQARAWLIIVSRERDDLRAQLAAARAETERLRQQAVGG